MQVADHVISVLGRVVHSVAAGEFVRMDVRTYSSEWNLPSADLASVTLYKRSVDGVSQCELSEVLRDIVLHLIGLEAGYG